MRVSGIAGICVPLLLSLTACASKQFLTPDSVDFKSLLDPAPAVESDLTQKEIQQMLQLQAMRTRDDEKRCQAEQAISAFSFSDVLGDWFDADDLPQTARLMQEVGKETAAVTNAAKAYYGRKRPPAVDGRIRPCVPFDMGFSYPSSYSTWATVWATVLSQMFPEKKDALMARAKQLGDDRVLAGVHFPSDVQAGRVLGAAIGRKFIDDPDFRQELKKAKDECLAAAQR